VVAIDLNLVGDRPYLLFGLLLEADLPEAKNEKITK
jgi:hypothetical protein